MDKASGFRHDNKDEAREVAACWRYHRESRTISMVLVCSLTAFLGSAEDAPWLGKDRC
jgi:hypothetical protein